MLKHLQLETCGVSIVLPLSTKVKDSLGQQGLCEIHSQLLPVNVSAK